MMRLFTGALALLACVQDDEAAREAVAGWKHPWAEFTTGSMIVCRETSLRPEVDAAGNLIYKEEATESIWTVATSQGEKPRLNLRTVGRESEFPYYTGLPGWSRGKGERKGAEEVAAGEKKYVCSKYVLTFDAGKDASQVTTIWKSSDAPSWAVRMRVETFANGRCNTAEEERLVAAGEKLKVRDQELACHVVEVTVEATGAARTVKREWRSDQVPGRVVRRETRYYQGTKEVESAATKMDVVSFRSKK